MKDATVLKEWTSPYPGCDVRQIRSKVFQVIENEKGEKVFVKKDSLSAAIVNEARVLEKLKMMDGVPQLVDRSSTEIFIKYIDGDLLGEVVQYFSLIECLEVFLKIIKIVRRIHRKNIVHADIRGWNFISDSKKNIILFDFEYAYEKGEKPSAEVKEFFLQYHHGTILRSMVDDWEGVFSAINFLGGRSKSRFIRVVVANVFCVISLIFKAFFKIKLRAHKIYSLERRSGL